MEDLNLTAISQVAIPVVALWILDADAVAILELLEVISTGGIVGLNFRR